jgi:Xaa-Pro aminopeptidase
MPGSVVSPSNVYLAARRQRVAEAMRQYRLDGLLLTHPPDLAWLSDFTGDDSIGLVTANDFFLVTDFRYQEQAQIEAPWLKQIIRDGKMSDALAQTIVHAGVRRVGFEANDATVGEIDGLAKAIKERSPGGTAAVELVPLDDVLVNLRKTKDQREIGLIRQSITVAQDALMALRPALVPGKTESELAGILIMELRRRGASDASFPPIIAVGANSSLPHYRPADVPVAKGQFLLVDWGCILKGYCSDLTRTFLIGQVPGKLKEIYKIVLDAQLAAIAALGPGVNTVRADAAARDLITKAGYGAQFGHGLGHGIGRDIHELPTLRKTLPGEELRPGMVVTVEPGIYLPGMGGVRIEDDVLITESGAEVLSSLDKSINDCTIA